MRFVIIFKLFFERLASVKTFTIPLAQRKRKRKFRLTKRNKNGMTAKHIAENEGRGIDAIRKRWNASFPGISFSADAELSPEMITALSKEKAVSAEKSERGEKIVKPLLTPVGGKDRPPVKLKAAPTPWILYGLMAAPAVASIQNMHSVTGDLTGLYSGIMLTAIFSLAPFAFIVVGLRGWFVKSLTLLMIAYECFCNVMRIYGGLTRFGIDGYPTRFLGLVTDFCNSGTYATARFLSVFMALIAAGVFYAAYLSLNKK